MNFFKLRKVAEIIIEIQQYQSPYRDLQKKPNLALFLQSLTWMGEEECYRWSSRVRFFFLFFSFLFFIFFFGLFGCDYRLTGFFQGGTKKN